MTTIRKPGTGYHGQIRKEGYPTITKSFSNRATAHRRAKKVESKIDRYICLDISAAQKTAPNEVPDRFSRGVLPTKKRGDQAEPGKYYLADPRPHILAEYRDTRAC